MEKNMELIIDKDFEEVLKLIEEKYSTKKYYQEMMTDLYSMSNKGIIKWGRKFYDKDGLNDKNIGKKLLTTYANERLEPLSSRFIACIIADSKYLGDKNFAKKLYKKAWDNNHELYNGYSEIDGRMAVDFDEYISVSHFMNDTINAKKLNWSMTLRVANSIFLFFANKDWAKKIY